MRKDGGRKCRTSVTKKSITRPFMYSLRIFTFSRHCSHSVGVMTRFVLDCNRGQGHTGQQAGNEQSSQLQARLWGHNNTCVLLPSPSFGSSLRVFRRCQPQIKRKQRCVFNIMDAYKLSGTRRYPLQLRGYPLDFLVSFTKRKGTMNLMYTALMRRNSSKSDESWTAQHAQ